MMIMWILDVLQIVCKQFNHHHRLNFTIIGIWINPDQGWVEFFAVVGAKDDDDDDDEDDDDVENNDD